MGDTSGCGRVTPTAASPELLCQKTSIKRPSSPLKLGCAGRSQNQSETGSVRPGRRKREDSSPEELLLYASRITRSAVSSIIKKESAEISRQCEVLQSRGQILESTGESSMLEERTVSSPVIPKQSCGPASSSSTPQFAARSTSNPSDGESSSATATSLEAEAVQIWERACRAKRMAYLLRELEITYRLLDQDIRRVKSREEE